jgi:putative redox protein
MEVKTTISFLKDEAYQATFPGTSNGFVIDAAKAAPAGPSPLDVFLASLAACIGVYAKRYLAMHKIEFKKLAVAGTADLISESPVRLSNIRLDVSTDARIADKDTFMRFIHNCPIHNTLIHTKDASISLIEA